MMYEIIFMSKRPSDGTVKVRVTFLLSPFSSINIHSPSERTPFQYHVTFQRIAIDEAISIT